MRFPNSTLFAGAALLGIGSLAHAQVTDGSFESGGFGSWVAIDIGGGGPFSPLSVGGAGFTTGFGFFSTMPTDGVFSVNHGFDGGGPGVITLAQDVPIDGDLLLFDYRGAWDLASFGATTSRTFRVDIEPLGGGAAVQSTTVLTASAGTVVPDTGVLTGMVDVSAFAGSTMRVSFEWDIPESFTGPGLFELDNVRTGDLPIIAAPRTTLPGSTVTVNGLAAPGAFYAMLLSTGVGPTAFIPLLGFALDIDPMNFRLVEAGFADGAGLFDTDVVAPNTMAVVGFQGFWQAVTFDMVAFAKSNSDSTTVLGPPQTVSGTIPVAGVADHYTFTGVMGEIVTIEHCRTDNTGMGSSTLDPFLCLVGPGGTEVAFDDDGNGDCLVPGPFGASIIMSFALPTSGTYEIVASAFQGLGGETGDYELTLDGTLSQDLALSIDDGPLCPTLQLAPIHPIYPNPKLLLRR